MLGIELLDIVGEEEEGEELGWSVGGGGVWEGEIRVLVVIVGGRGGDEEDGFAGEEVAAGPCVGGD